MKKNIMIYTLSILIILSLGLLSGFISQSSFSWYHTLEKPYFNPPDWIFGPVWTILYIFMGIILAHLFLYPSTKNLKFIFLLQLILNLIWPPLFFYFHQVHIALIDLVLLWVCLIIWQIQNTKDPLRFYLFLPYTLWVSFAFILNASIDYLNI
jgi:tryptophan-rich sensory protein